MLLWVVVEAVRDAGSGTLLGCCASAFMRLVQQTDERAKRTIPEYRTFVSVAAVHKARGLCVMKQEQIYILLFRLASLFTIAQIPCKNTRPQPSTAFVWLADVGVNIRCLEPRDDVVRGLMTSALRIDSARLRSL